MLIKGKSGILKHLRTLNIEYQKAKSSFIKASEFKGIKSEKKKKWKDAQDKYEFYLDEIYADDIDALAELGEIYSHLGQLADTEKEEFEYYKQAIDEFEVADGKGQNNPFHKIRIAENWIKGKKLDKALRLYLDLLDKDEKNLTCLINSGILAVRTGDMGTLNNIIEKMKKHHPDNEVLPQLQRSSDRLRKGVNVKPGTPEYLKAVGKTNEPIITKGTAKNLQTQAQRNGVLLLLLTRNGATFSQVKEKWLDNISTTSTVLRAMQNERDKNGKLAPVIELTKMLGVIAYTLTPRGMDEAKIIETWAALCVGPGGIKLEQKFGPGITAKLIERYETWAFQIDRDGF